MARETMRIAIARGYRPALTRYERSAILERGVVGDGGFTAAHLAEASCQNLYRVVHSRQ